MKGDYIRIEAARYCRKHGVRLGRSLDGVFGSPFIIADGEPFFGVDKLELVDEWLARRGW